MTTIIPERLQQLPEITLDPGQHESFDEGHCAMEVVSWLVGDEHTDWPSCVSHTLRILTIELNDAWGNEMRRSLLPLLPHMVGTAGDGKDEDRRCLVLDWLEGFPESSMISDLNKGQDLKIQLSSLGLLISMINPEPGATARRPA